MVVTRWSHGGHTVVTWWSYGGHTVVIRWSHGGHTVVTRWSHGGHTVVTRWSHGGHTVVTRWSHGGHTVVTRWSHGDLSQDGGLRHLDTDSETSCGCTKIPQTSSLPDTNLWDRRPSHNTAACSRLLLNTHAQTVAERGASKCSTNRIAGSICLGWTAPVTGRTGQLPRSSQITWGAACFTGVAIDAVAQRTHGKSASNWGRNEESDRSGRVLSQIDHQRNASALATGHTVPMG